MSNSQTHISVFCFPTPFKSSSHITKAAQESSAHSCPAAAARTRQQGQEVNSASRSASSPRPLTDRCTWVTSWVSGPNSCEWPETGSAACLVLLNIAALPTSTQQFLPIHPPFSLPDSLRPHLHGKAEVRWFFFFSKWKQRIVTSEKKMLSQHLRSEIMFRISFFITSVSRECGSHSCLLWT